FNSLTVSLPPVFYSFGSGAGDIVNPHIDDGGSSAVRLQNPFSFFGHTYSQIYVNNNGYLTFDQSWKNYTPIQFNVYSGRDIIAPLWTDIDNRANGVISYNQYSNGSVLSQATRDINQYFPGVNFNASWVFVATWDRVAYFNYSGTEVTFQLLLISDSKNRSYVVMNYVSIPISPQAWMAGYKTENNTHNFTIEAPSTSNLFSTTNVGIPGHWAFRVDEPSSKAPGLFLTKDKHAVTSDGDSRLIQLDYPFVYFGKSHSQIYVSRRAEQKG
uniref:NIDO domain-containing protein n=1 Tax=Pygocentrus nattereri TaxID=42514 RepID=A0AAR2L6H1_PYGNA